MLLERSGTIVKVGLIGLHIITEGLDRDLVFVGLWASWLAKFVKVLQDLVTLLGHLLDLAVESGLHACRGLDERLLKGCYRRTSTYLGIRAVANDFLMEISDL